MELLTSHLFFKNFMRGRLLLFLLSLLPFFSFADHIVGGEIQLIYKSGSTYSVALNFYFNDITGSPTAKDAEEYVSIFRKKDNKLMQVVYLPKVSDKQIPNIGGGKCSNGSVQTNLIKYIADVTLTSSDYSDSAGYYMSWERCCRNGTIVNLNDPDNTGITIYLEFPPVTENNAVLINSAPVFKDLQNIYGCKGHPFYFDFSATDKDGDSLVYLLKTPLKGHSTSTPPSNIAPVGNPAPYDSVIWNTTYSLTNVIHGNPSLRIDPQTGQLYVVPSEAGLFAFAVFCEEYRNGKKIGVVSRDFQFFIDNCPPLFPPDIKMILPDNSIYNEKDTLNLDLNNQYCYTISITDSTWDSLKVQEVISLTNIGIAKPNISISIDSTFLNINAGTPIANTKFCISPVCINGKYNYAGIYKYRFIVSDNSCPVPLLDTLDITFYLKPILNNHPKIFPLPKTRNVSLTVGDSYSLPIYTTDKDHNDLITLYPMENNSAAGINFNTVMGHDSIVNSFNWSPTCASLKNGNSYQVHFIVKDDHCLNPSSDTMNINFTITEPNPPFVIKAPNLFTPNGDEHNQYFEIHDLPEDNCENYFKKLEVYNRWGDKVFESSQRNFKWDASKEDDGIYYYSVTYSSKVYKSWVEIRR